MHRKFLNFFVRPHFTLLGLDLTLIIGHTFSIQISNMKQCFQSKATTFLIKHEVLNNVCLAMVCGLIQRYIGTDDAMVA